MDTGKGPPPVRKIRIKLGSAKLPLHSPPPAAPVPQQQQQKHEAPLIEHPAVIQTVSQRKKRLLDGYVGPGAPPSTIVECLRKGEQFSPLQLLPPWDESLSLPSCCLISKPAEEAVPQAKRGRRLADRPISPPPCPPPPPVLPNSSQLPAQDPVGDVPIQQQQHHQHQHQHQPCPQEPQPCQLEQQLQKDQQPIGGPQAAHATLQDPSGTSSSDNTTSVALGPASNNRSPPEATATLAAYSLQAQEAQQHAGNPVGPASQPPDQAVAVDVRTQQQQPLAVLSRCCTSGVQTSLDVHAPSSILPSSLMQLRYACRTGDLTTRDLRLPPHLLSPHLHSCSTAQHAQPAHHWQHQMPVTETVQALLADAQRHKREVDARRGAEGLNVQLVAAYAQSALKFMEACEAMIKLPQMPERLTSVGRLYIQTSELLIFTVRMADTTRELGCARDALSILCKRLSAVCLAREAALLPQRHSDYANRVQQLLQRSQQLAYGASQPASTAPTAAASSKGGPQPVGGKPQPQHHSPDGSTTSSQDHVALGNLAGQHHHSRLPPAQSIHGLQLLTNPQAPTPQQVQLPADMRAKLLTCARQITRGAGQLRRTMHGFQAFMERTDVQQNRAARLACVHIAAIHMDHGLAEGGCARAHALQALQQILELAASSS